MEFGRQDSMMAEACHPIGLQIETKPRSQSARTKAASNKSSAMRGRVSIISPIAAASRTQSDEEHLGQQSESEERLPDINAGHKTSINKIKVMEPIELFRDISEAKTRLSSVSQSKLRIKTAKSNFLSSSCVNLVRKSKSSYDLRRAVIAFDDGPNKTTPKYFAKKHPLDKHITSTDILIGHSKNNVFLNRDETQLHVNMIEAGVFSSPVIADFLLSTDNAGCNIKFQEILDTKNAQKEAEEMCGPKDTPVEIDNLECEQSTTKKNLHKYITLTKRRGKSSRVKGSLSFNSILNSTSTESVTGVELSTSKIRDPMQKKVISRGKCKLERKISKKPHFKETPKRADNSVEYPLLVWDNFSTRAVLAKPVNRILTPSERIGSNLTPLRHALRIPPRFADGVHRYSVLPYVLGTNIKPPKNPRHRVVIARKLLRKKHPLWLASQNLDKPISKAHQPHRNLNTELYSSTSTMESLLKMKSKISGRSESVVSEISLSRSRPQAGRPKLSSAGMRAVRNFHLEDLLEKQKQRAFRNELNKKREKDYKKSPRPPVETVSYWEPIISFPQSPRPQVETVSYWEASRPSSPSEQLSRQRRERARFPSPGERDMKRLQHYLQKGLEQHQVIDPPENLLKIVSQDLDKRKLRDIRFRSVVSELVSELRRCHFRGVSRGVVLYALACPHQRRRLDILVPPRPHTSLLVRAPVPWHQAYLTGRHMAYHNLFVVHALLQRLDHLWWERFSMLRFIDTSAFRTSKMMDAGSSVLSSTRPPDVTGAAGLTVSGLDGGVSGPIPGTSGPDAGQDELDISVPVINNDTSDHNRVTSCRNTSVRDTSQLDSALKRKRSASLYPEEDTELEPMTPDELEEIVKRQCAVTRHILLHSWLPAVARLFFDYLDSWRSLVPSGEDESLRQVQRFFSAVRSRMSLQLRHLVMTSVDDFMAYFTPHEEGNCFEGAYSEMLFPRRPGLLVVAGVTKDTVCCRPSLPQVKAAVTGCVAAIIRASSAVPSVEMLLFPEMSGKNLSLQSVHLREAAILKQRDHLDAILDTNSPGAARYLTVYNALHELVDGSMKRKVDEFIQQSGELKVVLDSDSRKQVTLTRAQALQGGSQLLSILENKSKELAELRGSANLGLIVLCCKDVNASLTKQVAELKSTIFDHFIFRNKEHNKDICRHFDKISTRLSQVSDQTAEVVELSNFLHDCSSHTMTHLLQEIANAAARILFLLEHGQLPLDQVGLIQRLFSWPCRIQEDLQLAENRLSHKRDQKEAALKARVAAFQERLMVYYKELEELKNRDNFSLKEVRPETMRRNCEVLDRLTGHLQDAKQEMQLINEEQSLLSWEATKFPVLQQLLATKEPYDNLWRTAYAFHSQHEHWSNGPFQGQDAEAISEEIETMWRTMYKLTVTFNDQIMSRRVAEYVKERMERFRSQLPVLQCICNPGLRDRHWAQLGEHLGQEIVLNPDTSLADMIECGLPNIQRKLEEISHAASKEYTLEITLRKMKAEWSTVVFKFKPWRESGALILEAVDDVQTLLDEHTQKAQTMRGSPYVKPFEDEIRQWETKLLSMQDILDAWIKCQVTWLYLEPIFASEDILKQMPVEGRKFTKVDTTWRTLMEAAASSPHALEATAQQGMLESLRHANTLLEEIQKGLNDYLEKKRLFFPRFFFISNDELLEILSETKDPERVQPHLRKCFEGIRSLHFSQHQEVEGMRSAEGELVQFSNRVIPAKARGLVERWLAEVEAMMLQSLQDVMVRAVESRPTMPHKTWLASWPAQVVLTVTQIVWTAEVEAAIAEGTLKKYAKKARERVWEIVTLVRGQLDAATRSTLGALLVTCVHGRDVIEELLSKNVQSTADFEWQSQMRFLWQQELVRVEMVYTSVPYGYEYLGNSSRLVVTPLTDRCFRTLMSALRLSLGGAPEGPAGTGKTETCKDLAKAVAKQCIIFNCSEGLDYKAMAKFFKVGKFASENKIIDGLAQSGAWVCFDEFNSIEVSVLSVVGQQVASIQAAVSKKLPMFYFDGIDMKLNPTCAMFITMNPSYHGRQDLPDNVKQVFRTVAMMVPDYAMIAKISLFSIGFVQADSLSRKIVDTYRLCSCQLSSRPHYDYGMRAVKAVLVAAGSLRLAQPQASEQSLILKAIRDVNLPKFLSEDVPLFEGILKDLFPDESLEEDNSHEFREAIESTLRDKNLQVVPWLVQKVLQLHSLLQVRRGVMLLGEPLSGKTTTYQTLAAVLDGGGGVLGPTLTEGKGREGAGWAPVQCRVINPKALTLGQLYGAYEPFSQEWQDGVLAKTFRELATGSGPEQRWLVLDGPVDALWVEHLNAALDDNSKLCLLSGEIIQMPSTMSVLFETEGLEQASPATVSRCGMVYLESKLLGWRPLKDSYIASLPEVIPEPVKKILDDTITWLVEPLLAFVTQHCTLMLPSSEITIFRSFCQLFDCLLDDIRDSGKPLGKKIADDRMSLQLQQLLVFAITWTIGGTVTGCSRRSFDLHYRQLLYGKLDAYPKPDSFRLTRGTLFTEHGLVYDSFYDKTCNRWLPWVDTIPKERLQIGPGAKVHQLIIPTSETARQEFFLSTCIAHELPMLIVGPSGTGKTAITLDYINSLPVDTHSVNSINCTSRTTAALMQDGIMAKVDRRRKGVFGPPMGRKYVVFVDDVNVPQEEQYGAQPPVEFLRQWLDSKHFYDKKDASKIELVDSILVAAMGKPGGGIKGVSGRFTRHFFKMAIDPFDDSTLERIFGTIIQWHFSHHSDTTIQRIARPLVDATRELYRKVTCNILPTPAKSHYLFTLRDFSRVVAGLILVPIATINSVDKLFRLWLHEGLRVFHDRLCDEPDRDEFFQYAREVGERAFRLKMNNMMTHLLPTPATPVQRQHCDKLVFVDFLLPDDDGKPYDEVQDASQLKRVLETYMSDYNLVHKTGLSLVLSDYLVQHVSRISRAVKHPSGHMLLLGVTGSGRRSAVTLAAFVAGADLFQVDVGSSYSWTEWREDIKRVLLKTGADGRRTVFLLDDSQFIQESFVEDVNLLLSTGEVPGIFSADENNTIIEKLQVAAKEEGKKLEVTASTLHSLFLERVKENLHIVVTVSPLRDSYRTLLSTFPALTTCCTVDWFSPWPDAALHQVGESLLEGSGLPPPLQTACVTACVFFHHRGVQLADQFYRSLRRRVNVTATSFLNLVNTFRRLLLQKRQGIMALRDRYVTGLQKLHEAENLISDLQEELKNLQPKLQETSANTEILMIKIEQDTVKVEKKKELVAADEAVANRKFADAQAIKDDCEKELAKAVPALSAATQALNTLRQDDVRVVKAMKNPPFGVKLVMEAVCVMLDIKPLRIPNPDGSGKRLKDYWTPSQKLLGDLKFLPTLLQYNKDCIPEKIISVVREKYYSHPDFDPKKIRSVSTACEGLCRWVRAMVVYDQVIKIVAPKKEALEAANQELAVQNERLEEKRRELREVTDKLQSLNDEFTKKQKEKKDLEDSIVRCEQKRGRSERLIGGLGGERDRWSEAATCLSAQLENIVGDSLLAAVMLDYLGPFTLEYRQECLKEWHAKCLELSILCSVEFSLAATLADSVQVRAWQLAGLPSDQFSVDNAIIAVKSCRWPLMIDPQGEASRFIRSLEQGGGNGGEAGPGGVLVVAQQTESGFRGKLEAALRDGRPLLLENVGEHLDRLLEPVLLRQTFKQQGVDHIRLGDAVVEYSENFRLYMTTRHRNPHYLPDITLKVTVINFLITGLGLEQQLLGRVVAQERPQLQKRRHQLLQESADAKRRLQQTQDHILQVLSTTGQNLLEDETAIEIMASSRALSSEIADQEVVVQETEREIGVTRTAYHPVAAHAALLFFCVADLGAVDYMYQYSLEWFITLYLQSIRMSAASSAIDERVVTIIKEMTRSVFSAVCHSLYERHKLLFALLMAARLYKTQNPGSDDTWRFLLTGGGGLLAAAPLNPCPDWLPDKAWTAVLAAGSCSRLATLQTHLTTSPDSWRGVLECASPHLEPLPEPYSAVPPLERLTIVRCLRPDVTVLAVHDFVAKVLGEEFLSPPPLDLRASYNTTTCGTPLLLLMAKGASPLQSILRFADDVDVPPELVFVVSMGQGQEEAAESLMEQAVEGGGWLVLQNCHLARDDWLLRLEVLVQQTALANTTHPRYRLWLSTHPKIGFPVTLLQDGVKISCESPRGLRPNILHSFHSAPISDKDFFNSFGDSEKGLVFRRLLYALCFFHALLLERREYGPLGWNVPYEFTQADLRISALHLKLLLEESPHVTGAVGSWRPPLAALRYLTGECHYGGRVTDARDRRLLNCLLDTVYNDAVCFMDGASVSPGYSIPSCSSWDGHVDHVSRLPRVGTPSVLGLHPNSALVRDSREVDQLFGGILALEPQLTLASIGEQASTTSPPCTTTAARNPDANTSSLSSPPATIPRPPSLSDLISELLFRIPLPPDPLVSHKTDGGQEANSMSAFSDGANEVDEVMRVESQGKASSHHEMLHRTMSAVLRQELQRYRQLLTAIRSNLADVREAVAGETPLTPPLDAAMQALLGGRVPESWLQKSYPSKKSLAAYVTDLLQRLKFFERWRNEGVPDVFWFSGFFYPHSFLSGLRQFFARRLAVPIDTVTFRFQVLDREVHDIIAECIRPAVTGSPDKMAYCKQKNTPGTNTGPPRTVELDPKPSDKAFAPSACNGVAVTRSTAHRTEQECPSLASDAIYVWGFYLEGARWDRSTLCLEELHPRELHDTLPVIAILPDTLSKTSSDCDEERGDDTADHGCHGKTENAQENGQKPNHDLGTETAGNWMKTNSVVLGSSDNPSEDIILDGGALRDEKCADVKHAISDNKHEGGNISQVDTHSPATIASTNAAMRADEDLVCGQHPPASGTHLYQCPVYQTSERRGELSTTGHSTNYIFDLSLPSSALPEHWVLRGAAALTQLDH